MFRSPNDTREICKKKTVKWPEEERRTGGRCQEGKTLWNVLWIFSLDSSQREDLIWNEGKSLTGVSKSCESHRGTIIFSSDRSLILLFWIKYWTFLYFIWAPLTPTWDFCPPFFCPPVGFLTVLSDTANVGLESAWFSDLFVWSTLCSVWGTRVTNAQLTRTDFTVENQVEAQTPAVILIWFKNAASHPKNSHEFD